MKALVIVSLALGAALSPAAVEAEEIMSGTYGGERLRVAVDGEDVGLKVVAVGCIGELNGRLARNESGEIFIMSNDEPRCVLSVTPRDEVSFSIRQHQNCTHYHGAACSFEGNVRRTH